ncbi:ATP-binding protein [Burkholderia lata]|uniref:hybrid sensor histidine kinase/response regulator n=1 Tax=Burkholderia lata (strain ATCC 17760 / DSM 23089 / LMG 22485 / NCIMB 9086 / R18194 / 383) TaxID=482957 RepID=UPI0039999CDA
MLGTWRHRLIRSRRRSEFNPAWLHAYQRALLIAGGAILGVFILFCAIAVTWIEVGDYHAAMGMRFLATRSRLLVGMSESTAVLKRVTAAAEADWNEHALPSPQLTHAFSARDAIVFREPLDSRVVYAGEAARDPARPARDYFPILALCEKLLGHGVWRKQTLGPNHVYIIGLGNRFVGALLREAPGTAAPNGGFDRLRASLSRAWPDVATLVADADIYPQHASEGVIWLPPRVDPITSELMMRTASWVFDNHDRPVALIVHATRQVPFLAVLDDSQRGAFVVFDLKRHTVLLQRGGSRHTDVTKVVHALIDGHTETGGPQLRGGQFIIHNDLPGTDWELGYVYSPWAVVSGLAWRLAAIAAAAALGIAILVMGLVAINCRILVPSYARAIRLHESERLNRALIRTAPVGLALIDEANGQVLLRNEVIARHEDGGTSDLLTQRFWQMLKRARDEGAPSRPDVPLTAEISVGVPNDTHLLVNVVRVKYRGKAALLCTTVDITARKQAEQSIIEARHAADQANRAKSVFLATMSHEIRTPLNAVVGNLELMKRGSLVDTQRRRLEIVESSTSSLLHILNDILDLSKVEAGQLRIDAVPFDCVTLLSDVAASFMPLAQAKGLSLRCEIAPDIVRFRIGDPIRIRQIVGNLLGNAIKFTEAGSVKLLVDGHDAVEIRVVDTGIGIPISAQSEIFELYRQADDSIHRQYGGTGLGLALCRRLVDAMGGEIALRSTPGIGSEFSVRIPLPVAGDMSTGDLVGERTDDPREVPSLTIGGGMPLRVLAVEDHPASRLLLADQFRELGADATIVERGEQALAALACGSFDIVLTDLGLPDMDGWTLAAAIRERDARLPVVATTAQIGPRDEQRSTGETVCALLPKPLSLHALEHTFRTHVRRGYPGGLPHGASANSTSPKTLMAAMREVTLASLESIDRALSGPDTDTVLRELHSLSGGFMSVGHRVLADLCNGLQQVVHAEGLDVFVELWPSLRDELCNAVETLPASDQIDAALLMARPTLYERARGADDCARPSACNVIDLSIPAW